MTEPREEIDPTREGLVPCPECQGTGTVHILRETFLVGFVCSDCHGAGYFHPFLSFEEFAGQVRERSPGAVFLRPTGVRQDWEEEGR